MCNTGFGGNSCCIIILIILFLLLWRRLGRQQLWLWLQQLL